MEPISITNYFDTLSRTQKIYSKQLEPVCRKWSLTRNELDVLLFLFNNPQLDRATDIVSRRGIAKSHVSLSVTNLECRGLLERHFDQSDRRTVHLWLTEEGRTVAQDGRDAQDSFFSQLYTGLTPQELAQWQLTARKIRSNILKLETDPEL